jgi:hypothetical protein
MNLWALLLVISLTVASWVYVIIDWRRVPDESQNAANPVGSALAASGWSLMAAGWLTWLTIMLGVGFTRSINPELMPSEVVELLFYLALIWASLSLTVLFFGWPTFLIPPRRRRKRLRGRN